MAMANNGIGGPLQAAASQTNMAYGVMGSTKGPFVERYHSGSGDEHGWTKSKGKKNNGIALSALTLLAFLFFLNILQNCLQEHVDHLKGKGQVYNVQPSYNIQIPALPNIPNLPIVGARAQVRKGDMADLSSDNSLEVDDLTVEGPEEGVMSSAVKAKRRILLKRKKNNENYVKMQKVNTLHNIDD